MNVFDGWRQNDRRGSNPISHRVDRYLMVAGYITKDSLSTASYWPCFEGLRIHDGAGRALSRGWRTASLERTPPGLPSVASGRWGGGKAAPSWRSPASIAGRQPTRLPGKTPATRGRRIALEHPRPAGSKGEANRHGSNVESGASRCVLPGPGRGAWSGTSGRPLGYSS